MPFKKKRGMSKKRFKGKKRVSSRKITQRTRALNSVVNSVAIHRPLSKFGMPNTFSTTLRYCERIQIQCAASAVVGQYVYRINDLSDPNLTGSGHQPYLFDQLSILYTYYKMPKCKVKIQVIPFQATYAPILMCIQANNVSGLAGSISSDLQYASEQPNVRPRLIRQDGWYYSKTHSIPYMLEVQKADYMIDNGYLTVCTAHPALEAYLHIIYQSLDGASQPIFDFLVTLEQSVVFSDLITQTAS